MTVTNTTPTNQTLTLEAEDTGDSGSMSVLVDGSMPLGEIVRGGSTTFKLHVTPLHGGAVSLGSIVLHAHTGARFKPAENITIYAAPAE